MRAEIISRWEVTHYGETWWEHTFKELEEQKKAETILQTLDGMSIASAKELLNKCEQCLGTLIIRSCE